MTKKQLNTHQITNELQSSRFFHASQPAASQIEQPVDEATPTQEVTSKSTLNLTAKRGNQRPSSRDLSRDYPTRDEIQEFSFRLRDSLKVKVQAEVPHEWQDELEELARELKVKKLELYRYILGAFLGKVNRSHPT